LRSWRRDAIEVAGGHDVEASRDARTPSTERKRVLVVDDDRDTRESFRELLGALGHDARSATEGWDALEKADEFEPDVVLLDLGLPAMNGYEIARELRRTPRGRSLVLVAVTGWGNSADAELSYRAGFDLHVTKPLGAVALQEILAEARHLPHPRAP
jgi:CheY-like chemotaxis protein